MRFSIVYFKALGQLPTRMQGKMLACRTRMIIMLACRHAYAGHHHARMQARVYMQGIMLACMRAFSLLQSYTHAARSIP